MRKIEEENHQIWKDFKLIYRPLNIPIERGGAGGGGRWVLQLN